MPRALIAMGSNLGDRGGLLRSGLASLRAAEGIVVEGASPIVATAAVGGPAGQPDFLNAVVRIRTALEPRELLGLCHRIEAEHDRVRLERWGPRTLDLDIIDVDGVVLDDPELSIPHPRAAQRAFVLAPWAMLEPEAELGGRRVAELAGRAPDADGIRPGVLRMEDPGAAAQGAPGADDTTGG